MGVEVLPLDLRVLLAAGALRRRVALPAVASLVAAGAREAGLEAGRHRRPTSSASKACASTAPPTSAHREPVGPRRRRPLGYPCAVAAASTRLRITMPYWRSSRNATASHAAIRTRFATAKPLAPSPSQVVPANTSTAASRSPVRTKNVSMACLALYFSSRLVGSHTSCRAVFMTE